MQVLKICRENFRKKIKKFKIFQEISNKFQISFKKHIKNLITCRKFKLNSLKIQKILGKINENSIRIFEILI